MLLKQKTLITSQKLGYWDFWLIVTSVLSKGKATLPPLFNGLGVLSCTTEQEKLFAKNFPRNSNIANSGISLPSFLSGNNPKLHDISVTPKLFEK